MKYNLIIDKDSEEEITVRVHSVSDLTRGIEGLVLSYTGTDSLTVSMDDEIRRIAFSDIECITVIDRKTYAITSDGKQYRLRERLFELENILPSYFIRINKSSIANEGCIARFSTAFSGAVKVVFKSGFSDFVSRRCFGEIKRRFI